MAHSEKWEGRFKSLSEKIYDFDEMEYDDEIDDFMMEALIEFGIIEEDND